MVLSTCENVGDIFETLRQRLHRNCRARQIGRLKVTFFIGRLRVKLTYFLIDIKMMTRSFRLTEHFCKLLQVNPWLLGVNSAFSKHLSRYDR